MTINKRPPPLAKIFSSAGYNFAVFIHWLERSGMAMWRDEELQPPRIVQDVDAGLFFIAECDGQIAGVMKF